MPIFFSRLGTVKKTKTTSKSPFQFDLPKKVENSHEIMKRFGDKATPVGNGYDSALLYKLETAVDVEFISLKATSDCPFSDNLSFYIL
ncbi:hypothetical protein KIN20_026031 [Parelaphostrongylus tenuis]|uniref:Uncharacterized protein n=1 Tax=Parelaphostrongylus tenuis TaxID=148309 RepID=A0AAD5QUU4_PARTN|nr:hypothetical protein KIN20_026031 [Parelaphostrongylus tenuis]